MVHFSAFELVGLDFISTQPYVKPISSSGSYRVSLMSTLETPIGLIKARRRLNNEPFNATKCFHKLKSSTLESGLTLEEKSALINIGHKIKEATSTPTPNLQEGETMAETKINMKLLVDKTKHKVLFAEAGKDCVDFLFHILSLPLGKIVGYLNKASTIGSIDALYQSLENLNDDYLQETLYKDFLLEPKLPTGSASQVPLLPFEKNPNEPGSKTFYTCATQNFGHYFNSVHPFVSPTPGTKCPKCQRGMNEPMTCIVSPAEVAKKNCNVGGYVKGVVTYMIMDDLSVEPMSTISSIAILSKFNVQDPGGLEEKSVSLDRETGITLLKASLTSKTVLSDVFLGEAGRLWH